ncbi:MAG TPA: enoyl-CoA hydratase-related protein [Acidimicrobiales bacterium]|jgi:enoyl-CoA hydratase
MTELLVDTVGRVRHLVINRPEKRNAMTMAQLDTLFDAMAAADRDPAIGCIVLRGAGDAFCAGIDIDPSQMDLEYEARSIQAELRLLEPFRRFEQMWNLPTPIVASVQGYCLGVGTDLAFHSDITLCSDTARFGYPPVRSMASPPTHMWTYLAGPQWSKRLLLTGDSIDGRTAERAGLVLQCMPVDELVEATNELAGKIARVPPDVLAHNKSICNKALEAMGRTLIQDLAREQNAMAHKSPDAQEFGRIAAAEGLRAALAWQEDRFQ